MDKSLYSKVEDYLNFKKNSPYLVLNGSFNELNGWIKFLTFQEGQEKQENNMIKKLVLNINENSEYYFDQSSYNFNRFNMFLQELALKFPNLTHLVINKMNDETLFSYSEIMIGDDFLQFKGNDSDITILMARYYKYRKVKNIKTVYFELLKYPHSFGMAPWLECLPMGIAYYAVTADTIYLKDVNNSYLGDRILFNREEVQEYIMRIKRLKKDVSLIKEFKVVRNGHEEIYHFN